MSKLTFSCWFENNIWLQSWRIWKFCWKYNKLFLDNCPISTPCLPPIEVSSLPISPFRDLAVLKSCIRCSNFCNFVSWRIVSFYCNGKVNCKHRSVPKTLWIEVVCPPELTNCWTFWPWWKGRNCFFFKFTWILSLICFIWLQFQP